MLVSMDVLVLLEITTERQNVFYFDFMTLKMNLGIYYEHKNVQL